MKYPFIISFMVGVISAFGSTSDTCSSKIITQPRYSACDTLAAKKPTDRILFYISIHITFEDQFDFPHSALVKSETQDLFSKYDFRGWEDSTTRLPVPPDSDLYSTYGPYYVLRSSIDSLVAESYVTRLEYQAFAPYTSIFVPSGARKGIQARGSAFDVRGVNVGRNRSRHAILFNLRE